VRTFVCRYPAGHRLPWHAHPAAQLVYAGDGFLTVHVPGASWVVPSDRGVWVPAGMAHTLHCRTRTLLQSVYVAPGFVDLPAEPRVVRANALVRALITTITARASVDVEGDDRDRRLVLVLLDQLQSLEVAPLELREPRDVRAREATALVRDDPACSLDAVAAKVGTSRRTLERCVRAETGMSLGQWRQRAQMLRALELLAEDTAVSRVALDVGYATPSAFTAAFRAVLGATPARFFARV
jgi:AraC-like DNA-binding protein